MRVQENRDRVREGNGAEITEGTEKGRGSYRSLWKRNALGMACMGGGGISVWKGKRGQTESKRVETTTPEEGKKRRNN